MGQTDLQPIGKDKDLAVGVQLEDADPWKSTVAITKLKTPQTLVGVNSLRKGA